MADSYKMGRRQPLGPMKPSFTLRRDEHGAIHFEDVDPEQGPTMAERHMLLRYFSEPIRVLEGAEMNGRWVDGAKTIEPGTAEHFMHAVYQVPGPFLLRSDQ
jgi:hypothetical protein